MGYIDPMTDPRRVAALIVVASLAILAGALVFQYWGGLAPCVLCLWQRYAYGAAIAAGAAAFALALRPMPAAGALVLAGAAFLAGAGIAVFHVGVEQQWWQGTAECGSLLPKAGSVEELRARLLAQPVVRCDEVPWSLFGVSLAGYNVLISLALAAFTLAAGIRIAGRRA
ncbi:MAG: disulfide bond formation protein B [Rhodospirillales bacterium]|nr:disulfide bond formation protein B [Rhodospirillales bacterium]